MSTRLALIPTKPRTNKANRPSRRVSRGIANAAGMAISWAAAARPPIKAVETFRLRSIWTLKNTREDCSPTILRRSARAMAVTIARGSLERTFSLFLVRF